MLHPNPALRRHLLDYLHGAYQKVTKRLRLVHEPGWNGPQYVLAGEVLGPSPDGERVHYSGAKPNGSGPTFLGSLEGWKDGVARFGINNPRLAFALCCAFAGPLLEVTKTHGGGGFNLLGQSSGGKSTALEAAASVWSCPNPLPTWRATTNGLEALAWGHHDGFLALDELGQLEAREAGAAAYMLANGQGKARAQKDGDARGQKKWQLIYLSTGELGLQDKLSEDGRKPKAGQEVRCPDIPCPAGIFADASGFPSMAAFADHLRAQARNHYGHAGRRFVEMLAEDHSRWGELADDLKAKEAEWLKARIGDTSHGQVRRVASRFALAGLAGELAARFGILPWPEGTALDAAGVCLTAWLENRGHLGASETANGLLAVVAFLEAHGLSRFAPWDDKDAKPVNMAGVRKQAETGGWDFYLSASGWAEACKGFNKRDTAKAAMDAGLLEPGSKGEPSQNKKTPHGEARFYIIRASALARWQDAQGAA